MSHYRIFDAVVASELPLPGLRECDATVADLSVYMGGKGPADDSPCEWIHDWLSPGGSVVTSCAVCGPDYLLRFPRLADFRVAPSSGRIGVYPLVEGTRDTLAHLVIDQVIPRLVGHWGRVVLHASAISLPEGRAVAFLGNTGRGKSTLASSFYQAGFGLLSDDCVQLDLSTEGVAVRAAYPSLRLWPESAEQMFDSLESFRTVSHYSNKQQLMAGEQGAERGDVHLSALFLLEDTGDDAEVAVRPVEGSAAAMAMIEAAFVLDVVHAQHVKVSFRNVMAVAASGLPVYALSYPRRFDVLPRVRDAVLGAVNP